MAPSAELDRVLAMIRARAAEGNVTVEDNRVSYEKIMSSLPMEDDIATERVGAGGVPAEWDRGP